ncbi:hypothetical protein SporoP37_08010 [Sporosarcina sp. P37]|nr:hypothetical protein SporoP37_08010 [Sporosarcina sp. P37]
MRKLSMALGIFMAGGSAYIDVPVAAASAVETPAYAKWSRLAVKQTMHKYPLAEVTDYLHIATNTHGVTGVEKFRLWLREDDREFAVLVTVTYSAETGKFIKIDFQELPAE